MVPLLLVGLEPGDHLDRVVPDAQLLAGPEPLVAVEDLVLGGDLDRQLDAPARMSSLRASNSSGGRSGRTWNLGGVAVVPDGGMAVFPGDG